MPRPSPQTDRVTTLVTLLATHPDEPWTLAALTRRLGLNKATVHSMLAALHNAGWLLRDPVRKTYRLGPALGDVGRAAAAGVPALEFASSAIDELALEFDTAGAVLLPSDRTVVVGHAVPARTGAVPPPVGAVIPLRAPFGAAAVAWADPAAVAEWASHVPDGARPGYERTLAVVRERGWVLEVAPGAGDRVEQLLAELRRQVDGDSPSVTLDMLERVADGVARDGDLLVDEVDPDVEYAVSAVNAAVLDHDHRVAAVLSLLGFDGPRRGEELLRLGERLRTTATTLSAALGRPEPMA